MATLSKTPKSFFPAMVSEVIKILKPQNGQIFLDMTFGDGGHSKQLLAACKDITLITLDRDPHSYAIAYDLACQNADRVVPLIGKWSDAPNLLKKIGLREGSIDGIIIETGASNLQIADAKRGFDINVDGPLDLRFDGNRFPAAPRASDVLSSLGSYELTRIFKLYGREPRASKFATGIVDARFMMHEILTTKQLYQIIATSSRDVAGLNIDTITAGASSARVLKALRAFVNNEFNELNYAIEKMRSFLKFDPNASKVKSLDKCQALGQIDELTGGKMVIISHGILEDSIVKSHFTLPSITEPGDMYTQKPYSALHEPSEKDMKVTSDKPWLPLQKYVRFASEEEVVSNPSATNARLRQAMRRL